MGAKRKTIKATALTLALLAFSIIGEVQEASAQKGANKKLDVIGLTSDGRLVRFRSSNPRRERQIGVVTGLSGSDTALVGIDFRVQDGLLYGVGNGGGIYTINTSTAVASFVQSLTVALDPIATSFGVDLNPAANALRIISDTGQNLRQPFAGMLAGMTQDDSVLTFTAPGMTPVAAPGVTGAAYTNNDTSSSTATTLFDIDTVMDRVVIQSPANNGFLVATGNLGVAADAVAGFDIYSLLDGDTTVLNRAFAVLIVGGTPGFYRIDLLTGQASLVRNFDVPVIDIAIPLEQ